MGRKHYKNPSIYDTVASNIKKYRKAAGLTQDQLADLTLFTPEAIRRIESKKRRGGFTIETVYIISKALNVPMSLLFETKKESDE